MRKITIPALFLFAALFFFAPSAHANAGSCSFDSDCGQGVKCRSGKCATAPGGSCSFDSDCGGAKCRSGKCANSPEGSCSFDSDCGSSGKCRSAKCAGH